LADSRDGVGGTLDSPRTDGGVDVEHKSFHEPVLVGRCTVIGMEGLRATNGDVERAGD
jgi:hypothetical protein